MARIARPHDPLYGTILKLHYELLQACDLSDIETYQLTNVVNITDGKGKTALFYAVQQSKHESVVRALINAGADVNITDNDGKTALFNAVRQWNNKSVVRALIDAGADVNITDNEGKTALFYASKDINGSVILALIHAGSDVNRPDNEGKTALFYAVQQINNKSVVRALVDAGADVNIRDNEGKTALFYAVKRSYNENVVCALIEAGADVNETDNEGKTALFYAVRDRNNKRVIRTLIDAGADINKRDNERKTALFYAVQNVYIKSIFPVSIDVLEMNEDEDEEMEEWRNGEMEKVGKPTVFSAANITITQMLFEDGSAMVNARDAYGRTPMYYALLESLETASLLIDKGANLKVRDNCNVSILAFFIEHCLRKGNDMSEGLNLLRENGVQPETIFESLVSVVFCSSLKLRLSTRFGKFQMESLSGALKTAKCYMEKEDPRQPIMNGILTTIKNYKSEKDIYESVVSKILAPLVELGADPNTADSQGNTAFHYATRLIFENVSQETVNDICRSLKEVDASFNAKNHQRETPALFCLSEKFLHGINGINTKFDLVFTQVYGNLIENGSSVDDIEKGGNSLFHLILILFERVLYFCTKTSERGKVLGEVADLLQLCCEADTAAHVTINRRDAHLNSPLHLWSELECIELSQEDDWQYLRKILNLLLKCGARLNARNENDETPLHLCTTWRAAKLLLEEGANPNDVDSYGHTPLLSAALRFKQRTTYSNHFLEAFYEDVSKRLSKDSRSGYRRALSAALRFKQKSQTKNDNHILEAFYEDVSISPNTFWEAVFEKHLDPWVADKHGQSVLGVLVESEAFVLAKTFLETAVKMKLLESDTIAVSVLKVICKDRSKRALWKRNLVEIILKARENPSRSLRCDGETPLHYCCRNIIDVFNDASQAASDYNHSSLAEENSAEDETASVHWIIAKRLLWYGADCTIPDAIGQSCLDIAEACPALKKLLSSPIEMD